MITIGLLGGIGSGKSSVARLLAERGARVIDADGVVHDVYAPGGSGLAPVAAAFGAEVIGADGGVDRRRLGQLVFGDAERRQQLTGIVWPLARARVEQIKAQEAAAAREVLVLEAPLLIEAGWRDLVDTVWLVRAPLEVMRERIVRRDGLSAADADARIAARSGVDAAQADVVIDNDGDIEALEAAVSAAWLTLTRQAR